MGYVVRDPAATMTSLTFTEDIGLCGAFTYSLTYTGGSPYDPSLFTFDPITPAIQVYTLNSGHIGSYSLDLIGTLGPWGSQSVTVTFVVSPSCYDSIIGVDPIPD